MDMYIYLSTFRYLQEPHAWYVLRCARVDFVWNDARNNRLLFGLIDQNRQKMMAVTPANLIGFQRATNMVGRLYLIRHFQVDWDPSDYIRYEGYAFVRYEWHIKINPNTQFIYLGPNIEANFPVYPWVSSIEALVRNERQRNLIDVVGKVIGGGRYGRRLCVCEMIIQDRSGYAISLILFFNPQILGGWAARAIRDNWVVYASCCKLITRIGRMNTLHSTDLTRIEYNPDMPEVEEIRNLYP